MLAAARRLASRYSLHCGRHVQRLLQLAATAVFEEVVISMADATDDKKAVEATGADAAYDVLEKDFQEVRTLNGARPRNVAYDRVNI